VIIRDLRVTEENRAQTAAGSIEEIRPVPLDLPVLQHVEGQPVPVETQAGFEVADHHYGMMDSSGHHSPARQAGTTATSSFMNTASVLPADLISLPRAPARV
jgi:hypothetical protein